MSGRADGSHAKHCAMMLCSSSVWGAVTVGIRSIIQVDTSQCRWCIHAMADARVIKYFRNQKRDINANSRPVMRTHCTPKQNDFTHTQFTVAVVGGRWRTGRIVRQLQQLHHIRGAARGTAEEGANVIVAFAGERIARSAYFAEHESERPHVGARRYLLAAALQSKHQRQRTHTPNQARAE